MPTAPPSAWDPGLPGSLGIGAGGGGGTGEGVPAQIPPDSTPHSQRGHGQVCPNRTPSPPTERGAGADGSSSSRGTLSPGNPRLCLETFSAVLTGWGWGALLASRR